MNQYLIYARKSSEADDRQALSIDSQLSELRSFAQKSNLQIVRVLTESKSAKSPGRPVFNAMIERINKREVNSILVWNPDRLSRNSVDAGMLIYLLDVGLLQEIITPSQTFKNTPNDKFMLNILWGQAKLENDNKGISVKRGMKTKAEMGWYPFPAMNGYLNTPERSKGYKIIIKDPDRFQLVRKMWNLMLTGIYTIPQVLEIVNEQWAYKTRHGKPMSRSNMYEMFSHPFYYGYFQYGGTWYQGKHEAMVTKEEWDKVQKLIHRKNVPHPISNEFLFIDLLTCGKCKFSVTGTRKFKHYKRTNRTAEYTYYHCTHKNKKMSCDEMPITEHKLQTQIMNILETVEIEEEFKDWAVQYYHEVDAHESQTVSRINANIQKQITDINTKLATLLDLTLSQSISTEEYDAKRHDLNVQKTSLQEKLSKPSDWVSEIQKKLNTACDVRSRFLSMSDDEKRKTVRDIGENLFLEGRIVRPELSKPFFVFADAKNHQEKYFQRLEPVDYPYLSPQTIALARLNPTWLPGEDSNL